MRQRKTRIHRGLVGDRTLVGSGYLSQPDLRQEYEGEIAPRTEAALYRIFEQCELRPPRRLLDLGAGTGAAARVVRSRFGDGVELVAVDKVPGPGILVADVLRGVRPAGVSGRFDLIICAHLLNELGDRPGLDGRAQLVAAWCRDLLEPDGTCIVIEPALRDTSRALLGVRDRLLAAGLHLAAPCFCQMPCPALLRDRDWCHDSAEVLVAGRSRVDFSYLILRQSAVAEVARDRYRVVSDPLKDKGRLRFFVCGVAGRFVLMRLDRDHSAANQALDRARRGDIIVLPNVPAQDDAIRVVADSTVGIG